ncbi:MAG: thioredoxin family protein [Gemmatimonadota bacterium]|nr:MAG: thioredoxin family protein [Gemmatimonadota bacterium]
MRNILQSSFPVFFFFVLTIEIFSALFSCEKNNPEKRSENGPEDAVVVDVVGEDSHGDSVTAEYLHEIIHSGRKVLLNFCYCCDCKITKPMLQNAVEKYALPVTVITVDVMEHFDLADAYGVKQSPLYILFNERGEKTDTLYGFTENDFMDSKEVQEWLKNGVLESERGLK